jgi:hypothetical protein
MDVTCSDGVVITLPAALAAQCATLVHMAGHAIVWFYLFLFCTPGYAVQKDCGAARGLFGTSPATRTRARWALAGQRQVCGFSSDCLAI